jgi:curved DNA-binding protein CbpA
MAFVDHYQTLGLEKGASEAEVKKAFRTIALKHHDDKLPRDTSEKDRAKSRTIFEAASAANEVLTDQKERQKYDRSYDHLIKEAQREEAVKTTRKKLRKEMFDGTKTNYNTKSTASSFNPKSSNGSNEEAKQTPKPESQLHDNNFPESGPRNDSDSISGANYPEVGYDDLDTMLKGINFEQPDIEVLEFRSHHIPYSSRRFHLGYFPESIMDMGDRTDIHNNSPLMKTAFASPFHARDLSSGVLKEGGYGKLHHAGQTEFGTPTRNARGGYESNDPHTGNQRNPGSDASLYGTRRFEDSLRSGEFSHTPFRRPQARPANAADFDQSQRTDYPEYIAFQEAHERLEHESCKITQLL